MRGFIGKFIAAVLIFLLLVVVPFVNTAVTEENANRILLLYDVTEFIDEIVDSRTVTESMVKTLNTKIAAYGIPVDYTIEREMIDVEPDPLNSGKYYPAYIATDETTNFNQGDHVIVHLYSTSSSTPMSLAQHVANIYAGKIDVKLSARIR